MAVFSYTASISGSQPQHGVIAADTPHQARAVLRSRGLIVRSLRPHDGTRPSGWKYWRSGWGQAAKLAAAMSELSTMLAVGIPLTESLDMLTGQYRGSFGAALMLLRDRVAEGVGLAAAMAEQPHVFDSLCVRMVEVGESSGNLEVVLGQLADFKQRSLEFKDRVLSAVLYPAIVLVASLCVVLFLMSVVVPMLLTSLLEAGRELPWPTRMLKYVSDLLIAQGWLVALLSGGLLVALAVALRTVTGQKMLCRALLQMPIIGGMAQKQTIARIAVVMASLMRSGVVYLQATEIAARSTRNILFREALQQSSLAIRAGHDIGGALELTGVFPTLVTRIFSLGQRTGRLEELLERLAADYDRQVATSSSRLAASLEPLLILVLGVFVGFILFATLLPILEAGNVL